MDVKALASRLKNLQESNRSKPRVIFSPKPEETQIRIVPYLHQANGDPFIEVYFHYDVGGERSILCPKMMYGKKCPICDLADEFRALGGKENYQMANSLSAKLRTFSPIVIRGREDEGVFIWGYGKGIYEYLLKQALDEEWGDFSDVATGIDLKVQMIKPGEPGNETGQYPRPEARFMRKSSPLLKSKPEIKSLLGGIPNFIEEGAVWDLKTFDELMAIVARLGDSDDEPDEDDTDEHHGVDVVIEDNPTATEDDSDEEPDDLVSRLANLLDD